MIDIFLTYKSKRGCLCGNSILLLDEIAEHIYKLQNIISFQIKVSGVLYEPSYYINKYRNHWRARHINEGIYEQLIISVCGDWRSYFSSLRNTHNRIHATQKNRNCPSFRSSKKHAEIVFTKKHIKFVKDCLIFCSVSKRGSSTEDMGCYVPIQLLFGKTYEYILMNDYLIYILKNIIQIKFRWNSIQSTWLPIIIYSRYEGFVLKENKNVMSIDIGLNNLCALTFRYGLDSYLISGRQLKSYNRYINNIIDQKQSIEMKKLGNSHLYRENDIIAGLRHSLFDYVNNYLHQSSALCIKIAERHKCRVIVIGNLHGIKQHNTNNRSFMEIPLLKLIDQIKYKAKIKGIKVVLINEAYTSSCSSIDLCAIKKSSSNKKQRIFRGAYITKKGLFLNSDVNGSLNILRRFLHTVYGYSDDEIICSYETVRRQKNGSIPELILFIRDKGYVIGPTMLYCI